MFEIINYPNFIKLTHTNGSPIIFKLEHILCTSNVYNINKSFYFNISPQGNFANQLQIWKTFFHSQNIFLQTDTHLRVKIPFHYNKCILKCNPYETFIKDKHVSLTISLVGISFNTLQFKVIDVCK